MVPQTRAAQSDYSELTIPVAIIAGSGDRLVDPEAQSARLHDEIRASTWQCVEGAGHMVHHSALDATISAIERVSSREGLSKSRGPAAESFRGLAESAPMAFGQELQTAATARRSSP